MPGLGGPSAHRGVRGDHKAIALRGHYGQPVTAHVAANVDDAVGLKFSMTFGEDAFEIKIRLHLHDDVQVRDLSRRALGFLWCTQWW